MNTDTIIIISTNITVAIGLIAIMFNFHNKVDEKFDKVNEKFDKINAEIHNLSNRIERLESKFGIIDERINSINQQQTTTNQRVGNLDIEIKEQRADTKKFIDKIIDKFPKAAL